VRRKITKFFKRKILRLLPWLVGIIIAVWVASLFVVRPLARSAISEFCNDAAVYIESGRLTGLASFRLNNVVIASDTDTLTQRPVLRFDEIDIAFKPWKLLAGKFEVHTIRLSDFILNAVYEPQEEWNFARLIRTQPYAATTSRNIPLVELHNGMLRISRFEDDSYKAITTISLNGQIAVQTGKREYSFSLKTDGRFGFADSELSGRLQIAQPGQQHQFSAEGQIRMPSGRIFENAWDIDAIRIECTFDHREVVVNRCDFSLGPGQVKVQGIIQENGEDEHQLDLNVDIQRFKLSEEYEKNAVVYSPPFMQLLGVGPRRFLQRYRPSGTGDVQLSVKGVLEDLTRTRIDGTVTCRDMSILYEMFPYRLSRLQGVVDFTGRDVFLRQLTAEHDDVKLTIDGSLQDIGPNVRTDLRITSPNMHFNEDLYQALKPAQKKIWYSFTPSGYTGIDYHFQRFADGTTDLNLLLNLKNANCIYEHFPYPFENLTGRVTVTPDRIDLENIAAGYDDARTVKLNGEITELSQSQPAFQIHIDAEQIPVDDLLVNAMPPTQRDFFHQLLLEATANVDVDIVRSQTAEGSLDYHAKIDAEGKRLLYEPFPLPMENVHLTVDVRPEIIELEDFDAAVDGGWVQMSGTITPKGIEPDAPGVCLDLGLENFDFNETFWDAAGADADRILGKLRIRGPMDVSGHLTMNLSGTGCDQTELLVQCSDNPVLWDGKPLGKAFGQLFLTDNGIQFENFQFRQARLETVPEEWLQGRLKAVYAGLQPQGGIQIRIKTGTIRMTDNLPESLDVQGGIRLANATIGPDHVIHQLNGAVDGHLQYDRTNNTWQALTLFDIDTLNYRQWVISDFRGDFAYDPNTKQFNGANVTAGLYGGRMKGNAQVDFSRNDMINYELDFKVDNVDVPRLIAAGQQTAIDQVRQGKASGTLTLQGDLRAPAQSTGQATAHIVNMQLGRQSTLGKILTAMQFQQPDEYMFSEFTAQADILGPQLTIKDLRMVGKPLVFRGTGTLDLSQKQIAMDWVAFDRLMGGEDTILDKLARGIGSPIWKVQIRGDLSDPQIETVFLSVLKQPLNIFKKQP